MSSKKEPNLIKKTLNFPLIFEQKRIHTKSTWFCVYCLFSLFQVEYNIRVFEMRKHTHFQARLTSCLAIKTFTSCRESCLFVEYLCLNGQRNFLELIDDIKSKRRRIFVQFKQLNLSGYLYFLKVTFLGQKLQAKKNG